MTGSSHYQPYHQPYCFVWNYRFTKERSTHPCRMSVNVGNSQRSADTGTQRNVPILKPYSESSCSVQLLRHNKVRDHRERHGKLERRLRRCASSQTADEMFGSPTFVLEAFLSVLCKGERKLVNTAKVP